MENNKFQKFALVALVIISVAFAVWSQIELQQKQLIIENQQQRLYNIADHFELWKDIVKNQDGKIDLETLVQDERNIKISKIDRKELQEIYDDVELYVMHYDAPDEGRKQKLKKYFSDLVLGNYFYITTDKDGVILEMFWDKP